MVAVGRSPLTPDPCPRCFGAGGFFFALDPASEASEQVARLRQIAYSFDYSSNGGSFGLDPRRLRIEDGENGRIEYIVDNTLWAQTDGEVWYSFSNFTIYTDVSHTLDGDGVMRGSHETLARCIFAQMVEGANLSHPDAP